MRRASLALQRALLSLVVFSGISCSDSLPTEPANRNEPVLFVLSEVEARAFNDALDDVRTRILPEWTARESTNGLAPLLAELTAAIAARNQTALRSALNRTEVVLTQIDSSDDAAALASELDAVRFILEHARPLSDGQSSTRKQ